MKVLVDMRPALDGFSGIPQEMRLLFRGLGQLPDTRVSGLLHSGNLVLERGLALDRAGALVRGSDAGADIDRQSQVVVSLQQGAASHRFEWLRKRLLKVLGPLGAGLGAMLGRQVALSGFEPDHFRDFVWRALFDKTLPVEDLEAVMQSDYRVLRWPWSAMNALGVATATLGHAVYPRLDTRGQDVFLAATPFPGRMRRGTTMIVRYFDAIPLLMPHTVRNRGYHRAMHWHSLKRNDADGAWFVCGSDATREDLLAVLPHAEKRVVTVANMVSHDFHAESEGAARVPEIIWSRKNRHAPHGGGAPVREADCPNGELPYLLMVATLEPRKNHQALLDAWELLRAGRHPGLHLVCVGSLGWDYEAILQRFAPWLERGGVHFLHAVPASDLRLLYRHARATVSPSVAEGFDYSGIEAMRCGGPVVASDIAVHQGVYGKAAEYFSPYAPAQLAAVLDTLIDDSPAARSRRSALVEEGFRQSQRYTPEALLPQWAELLAQATHDRAG